MFRFGGVIRWERRRGALYALSEDHAIPAPPTYSHNAISSATCLYGAFSFGPPFAYCELYANHVSLHHPHTDTHYPLCPPLPSPPEPGKCSLVKIVAHTQPLAGVIRWEGEEGAKV